MDKEQHNSEARIKENFLFLLLDELERNGDDMKLVSKNLNRSRQNLNYHLQKLRKLKIIERQQSYPFAIYTVTPLGSRIKEAFIQSESMKQLWRCHNLIVGFKIKDFGDYKFDKKRIIQMNNWFYEKDTIKDSIGEWGIHVQSTGLIKIYCPEIYHESPKTAFGTMFDVASRIANKFADGWDMEIGLLKTIREGHKELVNSEMLAKLFGKTKIGKVWVDASTGAEWMEETQSSNSLQELLDAPKKIEALEKHLISQTEIMNKLSTNIQLHLKVLQGIESGIKEFRDVVKDLKKGDDK